MTNSDSSPDSGMGATGHVGATGGWYRMREIFLEYGRVLNPPFTSRAPHSSSSRPPRPRIIIGAAAEAGDPPRVPVAIYGTAAYERVM